MIDHVAGAPNVPHAETVIMQMADAMVDTGLSKIGYEYINVRALFALAIKAARAALRASIPPADSSLTSLSIISALFVRVVHTDWGCID